MSECIIGGCCDARPHLPAGPSRRLVALLLPLAAAAADYTFAKRDKSQSISSSSLSAWPCPSQAGQWGEGGRPELSQSPAWAGQSMR